MLEAAADRVLKRRPIALQNAIAHYDEISWRTSLVGRSHFVEVVGLSGREIVEVIPARNFFEIFAQVSGAPEVLVVGASKVR